MNKNELRKEFLIKRNELTSNYREFASHNIIKNIEDNELFKSAKSIFIYVSFGSEVETYTLIKKYINTKTIYVPKIVDNDMKLVQINDFDNLIRSNFGILEPKENIFHDGSVDLVITPSVVFSKDGFRIGYGKGYYDKFFAKKLHKYSIGVSFDKLLQNKVPTDAHDIAVDYIITEKETIKC